MIVVDVDTAPTLRAGRTRVLFEGQFYDFGINCYDVTPDGSRFIMTKEDPAESGPAHVKVVVNCPGNRVRYSAADPSRMPTFSIFVDLIRSSSAHRS